MGAGLLCCLGARRQAQAQQRHGGGGETGEASEGFLDGATQWSGRSTSAAQRKTPTPRRWMRGMNRVFARPPPCGLAADDARVADEPTSLRTATAAQVGDEEEGGRAVDRELSREQPAAAATIQACFRRYLARRAFRALRSLVKMQAFARGAYVRKQTNVAIRCMKVLVRLQVRVRARQLLNQRPMT